MASSRWVGPALFLAFWVSLTLSPPPPPLEEAAFLFPVVMLTTIWVSVATGGVDDKPHRELVAAAAGGPVRLHLLRAFISMAIVASVGITLIALIGLMSGEASVTTLAASAGLILAGVLIGAGIGNLLSPPIVNAGGVGAVVAPVFLALMMLFPPIQAVLRATNRGSVWGAVAILPSAAAFAGILLAAGSLIVARRTT